MSARGSRSSPPHIVAIRGDRPSPLRGPEALDDVEPPATSGAAALSAWASGHGVLGLLTGYIDVLAELGDLPAPLVKAARGARASTLGEAILLEQKAQPRPQAARVAVLAREVRAFLGAELARATPGRRAGATAPRGS